MMKKFTYCVCGAVFICICILTLAFLNRFTDYELTINFLSWENSEIVGADGSARSFAADDTAQAPELNENEYFRFTGTLTDTAPGSELIFDVSAEELTLFIDGAEVYSSRSGQAGAAAGLGQVHLPIPEGADGSTVIMTFRPLGDTVIFPPLLRTASPTENEASAIAYANNYGIPAGAYGLVFVIVCGLFLLGIVMQKTDWRLLLLIFSAAGLTVYEMSVGLGYYFLNTALLNIFSWSGLQFLIPAAMLVYILLNIKRGFLKHFGLITLWSAAALLAAYLVSLFRGTYLSRYINESTVSLITSGYYNWLLHWITIYLVFACSAAAAYSMVYSLIKMKSDKNALELKNEMIINSYRAAEKSLSQTASLRHEFRKHLTAIELMYESGNLDGIREVIDELDKQQAGLIQTQFTENFVINSLLRSAAGEASENGISFDAYASVPAKLNIKENDLCVLLMNMLDNALEACRTLGENAERYIKFRAELKNGFLAVSCSNPFTGALTLKANGLPETTKPDKHLHGFGLEQMKLVAEKYGSVLDISAADGIFTVRTALKNA